jgi:glycosyltransferase involved in cell wall biosynthesis
MKNLIIIQTVTPDYRFGVFKVIKNTLGNNFSLYAGEKYFEPTVKSSKLINKKDIKNIFLFKRKLLFQLGIWHLILSNSVIVLEFNPRIISNWVFLVLRKILIKETVLWGHAWSRSGKTSKTFFLRSFMGKLSSKIIVYTNKQKLELQEIIKFDKVLSAPNSLYNKRDMVTNSKVNNINNIIYVGRLVKSKKPMLLIKAFHNVLDQLPKKTNLIIVGDGDQFSIIKDYVLKNKIEHRVILKGHIFNFEKLKNLYFSSLFSVSPGYIGLSVTQSFSFGVPMLVSEKENHSPEIEAVNEKVNALYFKTNDLNNLSFSLQKFFDNKNFWINQRNIIVENCKNQYSNEIMAQTFIDLV